LKEFIANKEKRGYQSWDFSVWGGVQKDHRYFMVDKDFREKLDKFSERVSQFNTKCSELDNSIIPRILRIAAKEKLSMEPEDIPQLSFWYIKNKQKHTVGLLTVSHLKRMETFADISEAELQQLDKSEVSDMGFEIWFNAFDQSFAKNNPNAAPRLGFVTFGGHQEIIPQFWELCLEMLKENETFKFVIEENEKLLEGAKEIQKDLIKRIEAPWRI
jgi:hypothetical protein